MVVFAPSEARCTAPFIIGSSRRLAMVVCVPSEARCAGPFISWPAEGWSWWYVRRAKRGVLLLLLLGQPKAGQGGTCAERTEVCCSFY